MRSSCSPELIVALVLLFFLVMLFVPPGVVENSYFDGGVSATVYHHPNLKKDAVQVVFSVPGTYVVTFLPIEDEDDVPASFQITLSENEVPLLENGQKIQHR